MKSKIIISILLCSHCIISFAQTNNTARFSLLTCSPSAAVYATFGHTALRYQNPETQTDIVFNYGVFRYSDDFLFNFVKGETYYELGVQQFEYFLEDYASENRGMIEQELNLTPQEVEQLYRLLCINYEPQNRKYLYNFFYDNCATRVRDIFVTMFGNNLQWRDLPEISFTLGSWVGSMRMHLAKTEQPTFRSLIHVYTARNLWLQNGIALALGVPAERTVSEFESMFLPDCLFLYAQEARIAPDGIGKERQLVSKTNILLKTEALPQTPLWFTPNVCMWLLAIIFIAIAFIEYRIRKHLYWLDSLLYCVLGMLGILVWFLSFLSIHPAVFPNVHVLWAMPLHIVFAVLWLVPNMRKHLQWYVKLYAGIFAVMIVVSFVPLQYIPASFTAVFVIMLSRTVGIVRKTQHK